MEESKQLLIIGAGNIGRGVIGSVFYEAGYELTFYDAYAPMSESLSKAGHYFVERKGCHRSESLTVDRFKVIPTGDDESLAQALENATLLACCVYVGAFDDICTRLAAAIPARMTHEAGYLDIMLCVNEIGAVDYFKEAILAKLQSKAEKEYFQNYVGLAQTLILRSGMPSSNELLLKDPLSVTTSLDGHLYTDGEVIHHSLQGVKCMHKVDQISARMLRKIYTGNMLHCIQAFFGVAHGCRDIPSCYANLEVRKDSIEAYREAEEALAREYDFDRQDRAQWDDAILGTMDNPNVQDSVTRVLARPAEKLSRSNRFVAPALLCLKNNILPFYLAKGIAYGLCYDNPEDAQSLEILEYTTLNGIDKSIRHFCGLTDGEWVLIQLIQKHYENLKSQIK